MIKVAYYPAPPSSELAERTRGTALLYVPAILFVFIPERF
jgi:hypothetical protein